MRNRKLVSIVVMFAFMHSWLHAAVIPGRWEKVSDLESGSNITVSLDTGDVLRGEFIASDRESIRMIVDDQERKYPKTALLKVSLLKLGWSRKKKAGIGALVGSAVGFGLGAAIGGGKYDEVEYALAGGLLLGMIGGGIGAIAGLQKQTSEEITIYEANSTFEADGMTE